MRKVHPRRPCTLAVSLILVLFLTAPALVTLASADYCDPDLKPEGGFDLQYRERGDRCEGFYKMDVSAWKPTFEIIGISVGPPQFPQEPDGVVQISCPWAGDADIRIRAVPLPLYTYYQMDSMLSAEQTLEWSLEVPAAGELHGSEIGVLAWLDEPGNEAAERIYVPVRVKPNDETVEQDGFVELVLRSRRDIEAVQWRIRYEGDTEFREYTLLSPDSYMSGSPIRIAIPFHVSGRAQLEVAGMDSESGEWPKWRGTVVMGARTNE